MPFLHRPAATHSEDCMSELCQGVPATNRQRLEKVGCLIRPSACSITGCYPQGIPIWLCAFAGLPGLPL